MNREVAWKRLFSNAILNDETNCWITQASPQMSYGQIMIDRELWSCHRLSYHLMIGPIPKGMMVCHSCDNPKCINPEHLFLGTAKDNSQDRNAKKRHSFGSKQPMAKLNEESVAFIKELINKGYGNNQIAKKFNVTHSLISKIRNDKIWTHVT